MKAVVVMRIASGWADKEGVLCLDVDRAAS
jgi:hypothetical protein